MSFNMFTEIIQWVEWFTTVPHKQMVFLMYEFEYVYLALVFGKMIYHSVYKHMGFLLYELLYG